MGYYCRLWPVWRWGSIFTGEIGNLKIHGQVLLTSWVVMGLLIGASLLGTRNAQRVPQGWQNFMEYVLDFVRTLTRNQLGEKEYRAWLPFVGTLFLFIFTCNWTGILVPWKLIELPAGELAASTNDINTTAALALLTSLAYFYAGFSRKGLLGYFKGYLYPSPIMVPFKIIEDFTKPLSLSFRLFGNILADELVVGGVGAVGAGAGSLAVDGLGAVPEWDSGVDFCHSGFHVHCGGSGRPRARSGRRNGLRFLWYWEQNLVL